MKFFTLFPSTDFSKKSGNLIFLAESPESRESESSDNARAELLSLKQEIIDSMGQSADEMRQNVPFSKRSILLEGMRTEGTQEEKELTKSILSLSQDSSEKEKGAHYAGLSSQNEALFQYLDSARLAKSPSRDVPLENNELLAVVPLVTSSHIVPATELPTALENPTESREASLKKLNTDPQELERHSSSIQGRVFLRSVLLDDFGKISLNINTYQNLYKRLQIQHLFQPDDFAGVMKSLKIKKGDTEIVLFWDEKSGKYQDPETRRMFPLADDISFVTQDFGEGLDDLEGRSFIVDLSEKASKIVGLTNYLSSHIREVTVIDNDGKSRKGKYKTSPRPGYYDAKGYIPIYNGDKVQIDKVEPVSFEMAQYVLPIQLQFPPLEGEFDQTSDYGRRERGIHYGLDLVPKSSEFVVSTFPDGEVKTAYEKKGYGRYLIIRHPSGEGKDKVETLYAHLSQSFLKTGDVLKGGQVYRNDQLLTKVTVKGKEVSLYNDSGQVRIGIYGNTGRSTSRHLHYEVRVTRAGTTTQEKLDPLEVHKAAEYVQSIRSDSGGAGSELIESIPGLKTERRISI